ncbi:MAG: hypothetical protein U1E48_16270 [Paracoccaceae bacterium]
MILVENGPGGRAALFDGARALIRADAIAEVGPALAALDRARADGHWCAGSPAMNWATRWSRSCSR